MRKRKLAITIVFFVGVIATVASAFSVYVLDPDSSMQINVDSNDIDVIERKQTFLSYVGIGKNISVYDNDIVSDVFSMKLEINQKEFNAIPTVPANSGLKLEINFDSKELFDYVKKDVKNEFVTLSYKDKEALSMEHDKAYTSDGQNCLEFDNETKRCTFRIPFTSEKSNGSDFYIFKIATDNSLTASQVIDPSSGLAIDNKWIFDINLNFKIVDDYYGYALSFNKNNFGAVSIKMIFEEF